ncbi:MAG: hypothetical protein EBY75_09215, partial [Actinobacteria bacterium]|nr:hypothetical protein [Actinomycetota bacterium]
MWRAPFRGSKPVHATITIPGSKSVTNRALILSALASSPSKLRRPLRSRDTELMAQGLRSLGIGIDETIETNGDESWLITPGPLFGPTSIDVGNAGTVMRFLPPLAALASGLVNFDGDPRSHERPLGPVISALETLGVSIGAVSLAPLTIWSEISSHLFGTAANSSNAESTIIWQLRLPRVLLAFVVGSMLASAGCAYQGTFRNPLADPYLLGVSAG